MLIHAERVLEIERWKTHPLVAGSIFLSRVTSVHARYRNGARKRLRESRILNSRPVNTGRLHLINYCVIVECVFSLFGILKPEYLL